MPGGLRVVCVPSPVKSGSHPIVSRQTAGMRAVSAWLPTARKGCKVWLPQRRRTCGRLGVAL